MRNIFNKLKAFIYAYYKSIVVCENELRTK